MDKENIFIWMELNILESGKKINSMGMELKFGLTVLDMKENIFKVKNIIKVFSIGLTDHITKENFKTTILKEKEHIHGLMVENIMVIGTITKCTDKVSLLGLTEEDIMANIQMIKNTGKELLYGLMEDSMKDLGLKENNMAKEFIPVVIIKVELENGKMEEE